VYEVELKFDLKENERFIERLENMTVRFRDSMEQIDRYFSHPIRNFAQTDEALRLRQVGDEVKVTWKGPRVDTSAKVIYSDPIEEEISNIVKFMDEKNYKSTTTFK
jgi:adenylate cyclase class 2